MGVKTGSTGWQRWQMGIALGLFCLVAFWFIWQVFWPAATAQTHGFGAYYSASKLLADGDLSANIYDPAYFQAVVEADSQGQVSDIYNANPLTTTLMLRPFSSMTAEQARLVWTGINLLFLMGGVILLFVGFGVQLRKRTNWPILLITLTASLLFQPVIQNFVFGQAYVLVFFLLSLTTAAFFHHQSAKYRPVGGIALAFSLLLKTAGWPLLILLFWLRKGRYLVWVIGSSIFVFLVTLPIFPLDMWLAYGRLLSQVGSSPLICVPAYQTTRSWLCHLVAPNVVWQEAAAAGIAVPRLVTVIYFVLGAGLLIMLLFLARKRPNLAYMAVVCWSVLFLPLGEVHHHTVLLISYIWFIVRWAEQSWFSRSMVVLAAICYLFAFPVNDRQFQSGWQGLLAYPYLAGGWLIFLGILWDHRLEMIPGLGQQR